MKPEEASKALRQIKKAVEKQVPAPVRVEIKESSRGLFLDGDVIALYRCPNCNLYFKSWRYRNRDRINAEGYRNYCGRCGQKLDWRLKH